MRIRTRMGLFITSKKAVVSRHCQPYSIFSYSLFCTSEKRILKVLFVVLHTDRLLPAEHNVDFSYIGANFNDVRLSLIFPTFGTVGLQVDLYKDFVLFEDNSSESKAEIRRAQPWTPLMLIAAYSSPVQASCCTNVLWYPAEGAGWTQNFPIKNLYINSLLCSAVSLMLAWLKPWEVFSFEQYCLMLVFFLLIFLIFEMWFHEHGNPPARSVISLWAFSRRSFAASLPFIKLFSIESNRFTAVCSNTCD